MQKARDPEEARLKMMLAFRNRMSCKERKKKAGSPRHGFGSGPMVSALLAILVEAYRNYTQNPKTENAQGSYADDKKENEKMETNHKVRTPASRSVE